MATVTEKSTAYLTIAFYNKAGALDEPVSISYRIDDVESGQAVRASTSVAPANTVEITLTSTDNTILNQVGGDEERRVTVTATYGANDQITDEYIYLIQNLSKVT